MNIDFSKLTRNYKINPLKRGELIPKEDLKYLFLDLGLTLKQMAQIINRHPNQIGRQCKDNNISKKHVIVEEKVEMPLISNIQDLMLKKFEDVIIDYKKPPLVWDYYIPSKDLYILYHVNECHGNEPFNENNLQHWEKVKLWADKAQNGKDNVEKNYYAKLINTWTVTDVLTRNTAIHDKLNFKEFFTHEDFMNWYNEI